MARVRIKEPAKCEFCESTPNPHPQLSIVLLSIDIESKKVFQLCAELHAYVGQQDPTMPTPY